MNYRTREADTNLLAGAFNGSIFQREIFASGTDKLPLYQDGKTFVSYFFSFLSYSIPRKGYKWCNCLWNLFLKFAEKQIRPVSASGLKSNVGKK